MILKPLEGGEVELLDSMGDDLAIVNAARVSTGKLSKTFGENERKLLRYLYAHKHTSPFEQVVFKFRLRLPIFVMRQLVRYRTARLNELSGRYAELPGDFYVPEQLFLQSETNKQKSGAPVPDNPFAFNATLSSGNTALRNEIKFQSAMAVGCYKELLRQGVSREQARMVLPLNLFTECVWQIDLHNCIKFLLQRLSSDAQDEIRWYAQAIALLVSRVCPETWEMLQATLPLGWANKHNVEGSRPIPTPIRPDPAPVRFSAPSHDLTEVKFRSLPPI